MSDHYFNDIVTVNFHLLIGGIDSAFKHWYFVLNGVFFLKLYVRVTNERTYFYIEFLVFVLHISISKPFKGGVISEGIFNLVPSSNKSLSSTFLNFSLFEYLKFFDFFAVVKVGKFQIFKKWKVDGKKWFHTFVWRLKILSEISPPLRGSASLSVTSIFSWSNAGAFSSQIWLLSNSLNEWLEPKWSIQ